MRALLTIEKSMNKFLLGLIILGALSLTGSRAKAQGPTEGGTPTTLPPGRVACDCAGAMSAYTALIDPPCTCNVVDCDSPMVTSMYKNPCGPPGHTITIRATVFVNGPCGMPGCWAWLKFKEDGVGTTPPATPPAWSPECKP